MNAKVILFSQRNKYLSPNPLMRMNKKMLTRNLLTAMLTVFLLSPCTTLCSWAVQKDSDLEVMEYHYRDSAKISQGGYTVYDAKVEIPLLGGVVTKAVHDSILAFIVRAEDNKLPSARNTSDLKKALDKIYHQKAEAYFKGHRDILKEDEGMDNGLPWYFEVEINVKCHCSDYITLYVVGDDYMGGAHGMPFEYGRTFLTSNGYMMTWNDYAKRPEYLRPSISRNLASRYLHNPDKIQPLPRLDPWLFGDRVVFKYTPYEIAPFASGMPEAQIQYSNIQEFIDPAIVRLCQKYADEKGPVTDEDHECEEAGHDCTCGEGGEGDEDVLIYNTFSNSFDVEGAPNIKSFVKAVFGESASNGTMDIKNGYWTLHEEGSGSTSYNAAYWNRTDGSKLFIISYSLIEFVTLPRKITMSSNPWLYYTVTPLEDNDGQGIEEETGYLTYLYNAASHKLEPIFDMSILGNMADIYEHRYLLLPQHGKDIKVREGSRFKGQYRYRTLRWDGMKFHDGLNNKD